MQITADVSKISKTVPAILTFILDVLSESSIHFAKLRYFCLKRMLLVSYKVIFIKSEAVLLCVTMRERARAFAATI